MAVPAQAADDARGLRRLAIVLAGLLSAAVGVVFAQLNELALPTAFDDSGAIGPWSGNRCVRLVARGAKSDLAILIDPAGRSVSFVLGQSSINKEQQFEVSIPIKGEMEAPIALALGLLKQVV
jgi:hypothetical protein